MSLIQMLTPAGISQFEAHNTGNRYTPDANSYIYVAPNDVLDMIASGCSVFNGTLSTNYRNLLDGGDFSVNPWQRNIAGLASAGVIAAAIAATPTYFADRWFAAGGASSSILMSQIADSSVPGFAIDCKVQRSSANTNTAPIYFGQVVETADVYRTQGQIVTFSFWAKAGANFSAAGSLLGVQVVTGTGTNQTAAQLLSASWTGQTNALNTSQALTTSMARYSFQAVIPAGATQVAVLLNFTPVGTAGADDSFTVNGLQLEVGASVGPFEHRDIQVELEICQRYTWIVAEPAVGVVVGIGGAVAAANNQVFYMATPVQMVKAPTVTVSAGSFKVAAAAAAAAATGMAAGTTHTPNAISIVSTLTQTVGLSASLQGGGGSGYIAASADF